MIILWLLSCFSEEGAQPSVNKKRKTVSFSSKSDKSVIGPILKEEGFVEVGSYSDFVLYYFFTGTIQSTMAVDVRPNSFSFLHIPSGVHSFTRTVHKIEDEWALHRTRFSDDTDHVVAYGGARWFTGSALARDPLLRHMGLYFHRLEEQENVERFSAASPYVFAGIIKGKAEEILNGSELSLSCSLFAPRQYWCQFPALDISCVQKTQTWVQEIFSLNLDQPTEGMYRSIFRDQEIGLCLPSGCYDCDTISCSKKRSAEELPVKLTQEDWNICLEKNLDDDPKRTQLCISKSSMSRKELSLYVDDCTIR